jgi:multidrug efflux pump subunit AcrA (membrane-fusion protein)
MLEQDNTPMNSDEKARTSSETKITETAVAEEINGKATQRTLPRSVPLFLAAAAGVLVAVVFFGIHSRMTAETRLAEATDQAAIPTVSLVHPRPATGARELVLPGNTQAFIDSPIYARTNGYLKSWYADIGTRVRGGQLLAEIETPELDQQLRQAKADQATAEANLNLSQITAERDQNLLKTHSVSTQERDNAVNGYAANIV